MSTPTPTPPAKSKASAETLAYELCQIKIENRLRDLQKIRSGNSLIISGLVMMLGGLAIMSTMEFTPFFIGLAFTSLGIARQKEGNVNY